MGKEIFFWSKDGLPKKKLEFTFEVAEDSCPRIKNSNGFLLQTYFDLLEKIKAQVK